MAVTVVFVWATLLCARVGVCVGGGGPCCKEEVRHCSTVVDASCSSDLPGDTPGTSENAVAHAFTGVSLVV